MSGTLIRNAARQLTAWTRKPPSSGPTIEVAEVPDAHRPMARPRASPSKAAVMIERLPGTSTAPNAAWMMRAAMRTSMVGASPQMTDATPKPERPIRNIRRRP